MKKPVVGLIVLLLSLSLIIVGCGEKKDAAPLANPTKAATSDKDTILNLLAKGKQHAGLSYDFVMTGKEMKDGAMSGKMWLAGTKMKTEMTLQGEKIIAIVDGDTVYQYTPAANMAMKFSTKGVADQTAKSPEPPTKFTDNIDKSTVKIVETTTYEGQKCIVVITKDDTNQVKMWLSEEYGIPMKVEISSAEGITSTFSYKNIKVGPVPDDTFKLPAGTQVQDMSELMKNIQQSQPKKP